MKKRFIPTLIGGIIFVLLAIYANKYEIDPILPAGQNPSVSVLGIKDSEVTSISFGKGKNYPIKVTFKDQSAKIVAPSEFTCDYAEAYSVVRTITELNTDQYFTEKSINLSDFGITEDSFSLLVETANNKIEVTLGNQVAVGTSFYLKKTGDEKIYMVSPHVKGAFEKKLEDLRDRTLFTENFGRVNEIHYKNDNKNYKLILDGKNSEWLIADTKYTADNMAVANLINNMQNLRVSKFLDATDITNETYGFASASLEIEMINENGKIFKLVAGNNSGPDSYLAVNNKLFQLVSTSKLKELRLNLNDLRDKFLETFPLSQITSIEVKDATGTIQIQRDKNAWLNGELKVADADVKDFTNALARSKVTEFAEKQDLENLGLADGEKCNRITIHSGEKTLTYWLGEVKGVSLFMMDSKEMMQITSEFETAFNKFLYRLRSAKKVINN